MNENIINSMAEADMKELRVPLIAVYEHPDGYPEKCVARIYDMGEPTDTVMVMDSVDEIREDIELNVGQQIEGDAKSELFFQSLFR